MKQSLIIVLVVVTVGLAIYGYLKAVPGIGNTTENLPQIEISPKDFDFGEVKYGEVMTQIFVVKNSGKEILEIKKVATSCGCTTAKIKNQISNLKSGEEVDLLVTYDSGVMTGAHAKGKQERIIYIKSNDPVNSQIEAKIYANVK